MEVAFERFDVFALVKKLHGVLVRTGIVVESLILLRYYCMKCD